MSVPRLTLDTTVLQDLWVDTRPPERVAAAKRLFELVASGAVDAAVTDYVPDDIPSGPLAKLVADLPRLGIGEVQGALEVGRGRVGRGLVGLDQFERYLRPAMKRARTLRGKKHIPDDRDWSHLHAHLLSGRDVFLTSDEGILCLEPELRERFGLRVMSPLDFLTHWCAGGEA